MRLPSTGEVLAQKYRIEETLGEGGFGVVLRATTLSTGRPVAVKLLKTRHGQRAVTHAQRFLREMRAIASLQSPYTLTMYDFGRSEDEVLYMVCEYIDGEDLLALIHRRGHLEENEVVWILYQVLQSLEEAHRTGILHRDIKPSNIRIFEYESDPLRVKVLDFGLAKSLEPGEARLTGTGKVIGTPRYMSPEQLQGLELTAASDIFSLGVVAVEMLLGRSATAISPGVRRNLEVTTHAVSPPLRDIVNRMVAGVEDRYQTASDVLLDLRALRRRRAPAAPVEPPPSLVVEPADETTEPVAAAVGIEHGATGVRPTQAAATPRRAAAAVGVLAIVAVLFGVILMQSSAEPPQTPAPSTRRVSVPFVQSSDTSPTPPRDSESGAAAKPSICGGTGKPGRTWLRRDEPIRWLVHVPKSYTGQTAAKVVVVIADHMNSRAGFLDETGFIDLAERDGFVVIAPVLQDATQVQAWDDELRSDDVMNVLNDVRHDYCVDLDNVFVFGDGEGSSKARWLACNPWVKAFATYHRRMHRAVCPEQRARHLHFSPNDSDYLRPSGKGSCVRLAHDSLSIDEHDEMWRKHHECSQQRTVVRKSENVECSEYQDCEVPFVTCRTAGGFGWAGSQVRWLHKALCPDEPRPAPVPVAEIAWEFFSPPTCSGDTAIAGTTTQLDGGLLYVPSSYDGGPLPLLIAFHEDWQSPQMFLNQTKLVEHAEERQLAVLAPSGTADQLPWRRISSVDAVPSLVEKTRERVCVDPSRIWSLGHGSGGRAADFVACEGWATAVATTSYRPYETDTVCEVGAPTIRFHAMDSRRMPVEGGGEPPCVPNPRMSLEDFEAPNKQANECGNAPRDWYVHPTGRCQSYDCETPFVSCRLKGGHGFPGGTNEFPLNQLCDPPPSDFPAAEKALDFFDGLPP